MITILMLALLLASVLEFVKTFSIASILGIVLALFIIIQIRIAERE